MTQKHTSAPWIRSEEYSQDLQYLLDDMRLKEVPTNAVEKCLKALKKAKGLK